MVWLESLKADARVRYLSAEARRAGVQIGERYATALGIVPDLFAGSCDEDEMERADDRVIATLRNFSPSIQRPGRDLESGLYLLDIAGLDRAFKGYHRWAKQLLSCFEEQGWEVRLSLGFTPFATEMATYLLSEKEPVRFFESRQEEAEQTLGIPLEIFSLDHHQIDRLQRFKIITLGDLLALEPTEVRQRLGEGVSEFYERAAGALFSLSEPLAEPERLLAEFSYQHPIDDLRALLVSARGLLDSLIRVLIKREEAVAVVWVRFFTEDHHEHRHRLRPTYPTADLDWLMSLLGLRLEKYFRLNPLRWGSRVDRLAVEVVGEGDPEKQGELFSEEGWVDQDRALGPPPFRDRQAALWALSGIRAEFGDQALVRARLDDHHLPDRDHRWEPGVEDLEWLAEVIKEDPTRTVVDQDMRVRRVLYRPVALPHRDDWWAQHGPYFVDGEWWGKGYARAYCFALKGDRTAWLYREIHGRNVQWRVQGWLQ